MTYNVLMCTRQKPCRRSWKIDKSPEKKTGNLIRIIGVNPELLMFCIAQIRSEAFWVLIFSKNSVGSAPS